MNDDLFELLSLLKSHAVEFLVIGAHAVGFFSRPRMTEDFDIWIGRSRENVKRFRTALDQFGTSIGEEGERRFSEDERQMVRIGAPPNMVDMLNFAGETNFSEVFERRVSGLLYGIELPFPCVQDLIEMKRTAGRPQDLADIESLRRLQKRSP